MFLNYYLLGSNKQTRHFYKYYQCWHWRKLMLAGWETFRSPVNSLQLHAKNLDSRSFHLLLFSLFIYFNLKVRVFTKENHESLPCTFNSQYSRIFNLWGYALMSKTLDKCSRTISTMKSSQKELNKKKLDQKAPKNEI